MYRTKLDDSSVDRRWYRIDASDKKLGRLSTDVAALLMGKGKTSFTPNFDNGDYVVVTNLAKIKMSGVLVSKTRYHHTGRVGSLKQESYESRFLKDPTKVLLDSVRRMLPKNKSNKHRMKRLKAFAGAHKEYSGIKFIEHGE